MYGECKKVGNISFIDTDKQGYATIIFELNGVEQR